MFSLFLGAKNPEFQSHVKTNLRVTSRKPPFVGGYLVCLKKFKGQKTFHYLVNLMHKIEEVTSPPFVDVAFIL